jgi:predicted dehydrogenase/threonine dehydrogenase-like Zn-dependent dehydrogenase
MKQLLQHLKTGEIIIEDVPPPICLPGGVVVRNRFSLVSAGTERATVEFARQSIIGKARSRPDLVKQVINRVRTDGLLGTYRAAMARLDQLQPLGYSSAGEVIEVGEVADVKVGDLVACAGSGYASHAEVVFVPRNLVAKLPQGVTPRQGAFATLGAIAMQGVRRAELTPGERVGVIGLGLLGQLTVQILRAYGSPVLGLDINRDRVEAARSTGVDGAAVIGADDVEGMARAFSGGAGLDAVIITAASKSSEPVELAGRLLRERGRVSAVGDVGMDVPRRIYYAKELDFRVSRSYGPGRYDPSYEEHGIDYPLPHARWTEQRNMGEFLRLVAAGKVDVDALTTHSFPIDRAQDAYRLVVDNPAGEKFLGVLLEYLVRAEPAGRRVALPASPAKGAAGKVGTIRVGLIGAGGFATSTIVPALRALPDVRVHAVASAGGATARELARRTGAEYATSDYREIIADPQVDVIVAATRHNLGSAIAAEALRAGRHVHVEKPLAITLDGLRTVAKAAEGSQAKLMVGFNRRFAPSTRAAQMHFRGRSTPLVMVCRVNAGFIPADHWVHDPVEGGGRIKGEVCHFVDLLQHFAGAAPVKVNASRLPPAGDLVLWDDNVSTTIEFADGSLGTIIYSALGADALPKERVEIMGAGRSAVIDNFRAAELYQGKERKVASAGQDKGHRAQFAAFVSAIASGGPSPVPARELLLSTLATLCIEESLRTGQPVQVDLDSALSGPGTPLPG